MSLTNYVEKIKQAGSVEMTQALKKRDLHDAAKHLWLDIRRLYKLSMHGSDREFDHTFMYGPITVRDEEDGLKLTASFSSQDKIYQIASEIKGQIAIWPVRNSFSGSITLKLDVNWAKDENQLHDILILCMATLNFR